jgi:hypothetical protein
MKQEPRRDREKQDKHLPVKARTLFQGILSSKGICCASCIMMYYSCSECTSTLFFSSLINFPHGMNLNYYHSKQTSHHDSHASADVFGECLDEWGHKRFINVVLVEILEFVEVNFVCPLTTNLKEGKNGSLFGQSSGKKCGFLLW